MLFPARGNWEVKTEHNGVDTIQGCFQNTAFTGLLLKDQSCLGTAVLHISFKLKPNISRELKVWPVKNLWYFWKCYSIFLNIVSVINTLVRMAKHVFQFGPIKQIHFHYTEKITSIFYFSCFVETEGLSWVYFYKYSALAGEVWQNVTTYFPFNF